MKQEIKVIPAFDKRHADPSKNYGIHGAEMLFILTGEKGAVVLICSLTGICLM